VGISAEGQGSSVDEAIQQALRELQLAPDQVTIEILSAGGRRGLFGGGKRAHVRATAKDEAAATLSDSPEADIRQEEAVAAHDETESKGDEMQEAEVAESVTDGATAAEGDVEELSPEEWMDLLDQEAEVAADFVEGLLDRLDLPGDLEIEVTEEEALVNVQDLGSGLLIGRRGATLDALQELVRSAVQRQTQRRSHVRVDVEGYRARQIEKLRDKCREAIAEVRETGEPVRLEPMDAYERKMMHDLVAKTGGVTSSSEGAEPKRRVVINPA
jgi:spoIIIJ-associated protein